MDDTDAGRPRRGRHAPEEPADQVAPSPEEPDATVRHERMPAVPQEDTDDVVAAADDEPVGPSRPARTTGDLVRTGVRGAGQLLVTAGDNPERISSEGAWVSLCGIAPIPATSGIIDNRFRLNSGGDRHANNAIWRIVITRLGQHEPRTVAYMNRRLAEGKSKRYIIRCLIG